MKKKLLYGVLILFSGIISIACSNSDDYIPNTSEEIQDLIYLESFSDTLGGFVAVDVSGEQKWAIDKARQYAFMSGYVNPTNYANEDWLISPEIDLTNTQAAHFSFDHVARYFSDPINEATVWITEEYTGDLGTTSWTQLQIAPFSDPGSYTFGSSGEVSLTSYAGKKVRIAFKYTSTAVKAGTWEIKNFAVASGEAFNKNVGYGTKAAPYTVEGALKNAGLAWVQGYIVGYVDSGLAFFNSERTPVKTNVLISEGLDKLYLSTSVYLGLSNAVVQNALNLADNPGLIGKRVTVYGTLGKTIGLVSVSPVTYYILEDGTSGGVEPPLFYESFAKSLGNFTKQNVLGDEVWAWASGSPSGYAKMTGFINSTNKANEDWLISPEIDLAGIVAPKLSFDYVTRYFTNPVTDCTVWISTNYKDGLPATAAWTQINPPTPFFNASNWNFVTSGIFDLTAYSGSKIRIAFKYLSTDVKAGTWEVKNLQVYK